MTPLMAITIKNAKEIDKMRRAGHVVSVCHQRVEAAIRPGITTGDLNELVADTLKEMIVSDSFKWRDQSEKARALLRKLAPGSFDEVAEAILNIESKDFQRRRKGIEALAQTKADGKRGEQVSLILMKIVNEDSLFGVEEKDFGNALGNWATPKAAATLITMLDRKGDRQKRHVAMQALGVRMSEFPINLETAQAACAQALPTILGAPNVLRGKSQSGSMRAIDAIHAGVGTMITAEEAL